MYDVTLLQDLKDYKKGLDNINDVDSRYNEMRKYIQCRTYDKFYILRWLYNTSKMDLYQYNEYVKMVNDDYFKSIKYIMGLLLTLDW